MMRGILLIAAVLNLTATGTATGTANKGTFKGTFRLGRLLPSGLDLVELNGVLSPGEAAAACDAHPTCAGFTYRGLLDYTAMEEDQRQFFDNPRGGKGPRPKW